MGKGTAKKNQHTIPLKINQKFLDQQKKVLKTEKIADEPKTTIETMHTTERQ